MATLIRFVLLSALILCAGCSREPHYSKAALQETRDRLSRLKLHMTREEVISVLRPVGGPENGGSVGRIQTECWTLSNGVQVKLHFFIDPPVVGRSPFHAHDCYLDAEIGQLWRVVGVGKLSSVSRYLGSPEQIGGGSGAEQKGVK